MQRKLSAYKSPAVCWKQLLPVFITVGLFGLLLFPRPLSAQPQTVSEYDVKAAFLYNFAKFINWPEANNPDDIKQLNLCVLDPQRLGSVFKAIEGKRVKEAVLNIFPYTGPQDLHDCHILYLNASDESKVRHILQLSRYKHILTVGEHEQFSQWGGIINFFLKENKVRFEVNLGAAERADLVMSSKLLKLAKIYDGPDSAMRF